MTPNEINFQELAQRAYKNAKAHGFHDKPMKSEHFLCLVICELSEAVEADRKGMRADLELFRNYLFGDNPESTVWTRSFDSFVKDTVEDELADAVIRLLDLAGYKGEDLTDMDTETEFVFGNCKFTEAIFNIEYLVTHYLRDMVGDMRLGFVIKHGIKIIYQFAREVLGVDLHQFVLLKMTYNERREYLHGKSY